MIGVNRIEICLAISLFLLASHSHAQRAPDSIRPDQVVGVISGAPNFVLDRAAITSFNECVSRIGISASKDVQTVNQQIEECRARARQQSAPISERAIYDFKQQLDVQRSGQQEMQ